MFFVVRKFYAKNHPIPVVRQSSLFIKILDCGFRLPNFVMSSVERLYIPHSLPAEALAQAGA